MYPLMTRVRRVIVLGLAPWLVSGCSAGYIVEAAYFQCKILWCREEIEHIEQNPSTPPDTAKKLRFVRAARDFTVELSLDPKDTFTKYTALDREVLSWVVMGARKDAFLMRTWWFPIVGTVPYKGFFEKEDATALARELEAEGYETYVRGTDAYSTLGWFNDPILSTTLRRSVPEIVETVIHETLHTTFWIPGHVDFNESLANFVGLRGAKLFFERSLNACDANVSCVREHTEYLAATRSALQRSFMLETLLASLYLRLDELYRSEKSSVAKLTEREFIFNEVMAPFHRSFPNARALQKVNNAEIMQLKIYLTRLSLFESLFERSGRSLPNFITKIKKFFFEDNNKATEDTSPYELLEQYLEGQ